MDNRVVIILPNHVLVKTVEDALARMDLEFPIYQMRAACGRLFMKAAAIRGITRRKHRRMRTPPRQGCGQ